MKMSIGDTAQPAARAWRLDPHKGVAKVISDEVRHHGHCTMTRAHMAKRAGIAVASVDKALRMYVEHGMITIERRPRPGQVSLPSVIRIASPTWLSLLGRANDAKAGAPSQLSTLGSRDRVGQSRDMGPNSETH